MMTDTFHTKVTVVIKATSVGEKAQTGLRVLGLWPPSACTQITTEAGLAEPWGPCEGTVLPAPGEGFPRGGTNTVFRGRRMQCSLWWVGPSGPVWNQQSVPASLPPWVLLSQGTRQADLWPGGRLS